MKDGKLLTTDIDYLDVWRVTLIIFLCAGRMLGREGSFLMGGMTDSGRAYVLNVEYIQVLKKNETTSTT